MLHGTHLQKKERLELGEPLISLKLTTGNVTPILASLAQGLIDVLDVASVGPSIIKTKGEEQEKGYWSKKVCFLTKRPT